jgi:hypothetical protein
VPNLLVAQWALPGERTMNDLRRIEAESSIRVGRKVGTWFLAAFIISVMIAWFGFLGWGTLSLGQWLLEHIRSFFHT